MKYAQGATTMISYQEALDRILDIPFRVGTEAVPLMESEGRHLAAPIPAPWSLPRFTNSAMDGFAVRHGDLASAADSNPVVLELIGESAAGHPFEGTVGSGQAVRISTGATLPDGATAVVPREHAEVVNSGGGVRLAVAPAEGVFIREEGSDVMRGQELFSPGTRVTPAVLSFLSGWNIPTVDVYTRPRIGILTSGEEIKPYGTTLKEGQIIGSSLYFLERELANFGCETRVFGISPDNPDTFAEMMRSVLEWADIALTTAGVSVGDHDVVGATLKQLGAETHFWRVAVRPGKPMLLATVNGKPWFGLPGNPVSTCCNTEIFIKPFLRQAFGIKPAVMPYKMRRMASACHRDKHRLFFVYGWCEVVDGEEVVHAHENQSSGNLLNPARSNCLVVLDPGTVDKERGAMARTIDLV
ncbi:MAG: molybdopterin molybdotransferase MoeA [Candidatus Sumerlaeia bacterium]|nr:molybdopterin molybdotransferase MoeA [Candidatus Sumerlaeia bacterium]